MVMEAWEDTAKKLTETETCPFVLHCVLSQMGLLSLDSGNDDSQNSDDIHSKSQIDKDVSVFQDNTSAYVPLQIS